MPTVPAPRPGEIFISYSHRDGRDLAFRLCENLERLGYCVWLDRRLAGGDSTKEIDDAVDRCSVMIALLTRESIKSPWCRGEHVRALRQAQLAQDAGLQQTGSVVAAKRVIPVRVHANVLPPVYFGDAINRDFIDLQRYEKNFEELRSDLESSGATGRPPGYVTIPEKYARTHVTAPAPPALLVNRPEERLKLVRAVLSDTTDEPVVLIAMGGTAGVGKSVLALDICREEAVKAAFADGVIWVDMGPEPTNLAQKIREVGRALGDDSAEAYETDQSAAVRLREIVADRAVLLVVDDVWTRRQLDPFLLNGPRTRTLLTTRNKFIAFEAGTRPIDLGVFRRDESLTFLRKCVPGADAQRLDDIAERLGDLPQALAIAGAHLGSGAISPTAWIRKFRDLSNLRRPDGGPDVEHGFDIALSQLPADRRTRYCDLGIFPPATHIPVRVASKLWRMDEPNLSVSDLISTLDNFCLIELRARESIRLHSLLRDYVRGKRGDAVQALQRRFLDSYGSPERVWWEVPDDGYLYNHLAYHLRDAGQDQELRELLLAFDWQRIRLKRSGVSALLSDFEFLPEDRETRLVQTALRLSEGALAVDPDQLAGQLLGRLSPEFGTGIDALLRQASATQGIWLRPFSPTLTSADGPLRHALQGHAEGVSAVAVTPDQRTLVSGSDDGTVKLWLLPSGQERETLMGSGAGVKGVAVSTTHVVASFDDGSLTAWEPESGRTSPPMRRPSAGVKAVAFTGAGTNVVAGYDDGAICEWDVASGREGRTFVGHTAPIRALCVSPDGNCMVSGSEDGTARVWDMQSQEQRVLSSIHSSTVSAVAFLDADRVVSASWDRTVKVWDLRTGSVLSELKRHTNAVTCVAITTDGRVVSGSADDTLRVWDPKDATARELQLIGHTSWVRAVALADSGRTVISASDDGTIGLWDLGHRTARGRASHSSWLTGLAVLADGDRAISASADATLKLWDIRQANELATLVGHDARVTCVVACPDGRAISGSDDHTIRIWDLQSEPVARSLKGHTAPVSAVALAEDAGVIVSGSADRTVITWDLHSGARRQTLGGHSSRIRAVACTRNGQLALSGSADGGLVLWDVDASSHTVLRSNGPGIKSLTMVPHQTIAVSGADDGTVAVWDLQERRMIHSWKGHSKRVDSLSATGDILVSASSDKGLVVWRFSRYNATPVMKVAEFTADRELYACAVNATGTVVVAGDASGATHFLQLHGAENPKRDGSFSREF